jgi:hypothetical protein
MKQGMQESYEKGTAAAAAQAVSFEFAVGSVTVKTERIIGATHFS